MQLLARQGPEPSWAALARAPEPGEGGSPCAAAVFTFQCKLASPLVSDASCPRPLLLRLLPAAAAAPSG